MVRTVELKPKAFADIHRNVSWLVRNVSVKFAAQWQAAINRTIQSLEKNAEQWSEAEEAAAIGVKLQVKPHGRGRHIYRILFTIAGEKVRIHRIRHAAQDQLTADDL